MNEEKKLFRFRVALLIWILAVNLVLQLMHLNWGWVIFMSNIILFTLSGDAKQNFIAVEIGGLVGLLAAYFAAMLITAATPVVGSVSAVMLALVIVLTVIILGGGKYPLVLNNCAFAYFTCALMIPELVIPNFTVVIVVFVLGTIVTNGASLLLAQKILS